MFNTNRWNQLRYTLYLPIYDLIGKIFSSSRKRSISLLQIKPKEKVLLVGAGTGLDFEFIPESTDITATDITPMMVERMKKSNSKNVNALVMDGQNLEFPDNTFDKIILHLIVAVIPDPERCIKEAERVLKPGGKIAVFDKFLDNNKKPSLGRKMLNIITSTFFSDINRKLGNLIALTSLKEIHYEKADFGGNFIISILKKPHTN